MDFASPVAASTAGEPNDSFNSGKNTFATRTFTKAKLFATKRQGLSIDASETAVRYREYHHPPASGEGLRS
jgi:hypothetical protein